MENPTPSCRLHEKGLVDEASLMPAFILLQYNCATDNEREKLDTVILRILHHAKVR